MTPEQAIEILKQAQRKLVASGDEHAILAQAIQVLHKLVVNAKT